MTTHVMNRRTSDRGVLLRLDHGEPVVRWFGDHTEYPCGWRNVDVVSSTEYLLAEGRFEVELWVAANGDVWRRRVTTFPCEPGVEHVTNRGDLCWHCGVHVDALDDVEVFTLLSAQGFPAQTSHPQTRAEIEEFAGVLLPVGSPEAHARAVGSTPTSDEPGCPLVGALGILSLVLVVVVLLAIVRLTM